MATSATSSIALSSGSKALRFQSGKISRFLLRDRTLGYLFLAPALLVILGMVVYPFVGAVLLTFQEKTAGAPGTWIGLANYRELLSNEVFSRTVYNSIFYTVVCGGAEVCLRAQHGAGAQPGAALQQFLSLLPAHPLGHSHGDLGVELALDLRRRQRAHQQRARAPGADRRDHLLALRPQSRHVLGDCGGGLAGHALFYHGLPGRPAVHLQGALRSG